MVRMTEQMKAIQRDREDQLLLIAQSVSPNDLKKLEVEVSLGLMRDDKMTHGYILRSLAGSIIDYSRETHP